MVLLLMPLTFAATSALQMFLPGAAELLALLRTCQLALSMNVIIELLFILNGSQKQIVGQLPEEPIAVFGKPPLCCLCCKQKVQLWHLRFFVFGLQQFMVTLPVVGVIDAYNHPYADSGPFATTDKICGIVVTVSTLFGMWSFKCLLPLMTNSIKNQANVNAMEHFVLLQMILSRLLEKVLQLAVRDDLESESWVMPNSVFVSIITGFITCVCQVGLAVLGLGSYTADASMYPAVDFSSGLPPDTIAVLDMGGIDPDKWQRLRELQDTVAAVAPLLEGARMDGTYSSEESSTEHACA
eukprot:s440_g18.t1